MYLTVEWLEADAQGRFACGTAGGERVLCYHALPLVTTQVADGDPPYTRGGLFQVWSPGELIPVQRMLDYNQSQIRE